MNNPLNLKKILLLAVATVLSFCMYAQVKFGPKVGGNLSNAIVKYDGNKNNIHNLKFGFFLGGIVEFSIPLIPISIQPELLYLYNRANAVHNFETYPSLGCYTSFHQIQIPVNVKFKLGTEVLGFFATLGPYIGYVLAGNYVYEDNSGSIYSDNSTMKRFDYGLGIGAGIRFFKFMFGAGFQYGFANLTSVNSRSFKLWNTNLSLSYLF